MKGPIPGQCKQELLDRPTMLDRDQHGEDSEDDEGASPTAQERGERRRDEHERDNADIGRQLEQVTSAPVAMKGAGRPIAEKERKRQCHHLRSWQRVEPHRCGVERPGPLETQFGRWQPLDGSESHR